MYLITGFIAIVCFTICGVSSKRYGDEVAGKYCWPLAFVGIAALILNLLILLKFKGF